MDVYRLSKKDHEQLGLADLTSKYLLEMSGFSVSVVF